MKTFRQYAEAKCRCDKKKKKLRLALTVGGEPVVVGTQKESAGEFRRWFDAQEAVVRRLDPNSPTGANARRVYVSRLPNPNVQALERAKAQVAAKDIDGALESIWSALENYTSQGVHGDQDPNYRVIRQVYDHIAKDRNPAQAALYQQLIDIALKQLGGGLGGVKV